MIRRVMARLWRAQLLIVMAVVLVGCPKPPPGYEELSQEVNLNQIKGYYLGVREAYKTARREKKPGTDQPLMDDASFLLAVKADEAYTAGWNRYLQLRREGREKPADLILVAANLKVLQGIVKQFAPDIMKDVPDLLGNILHLE